MASLMLVRNVVGELQRKRTLAASRGFLAAARLSCIVKVFVSNFKVKKSENLDNAFYVFTFF